MLRALAEACERVEVVAPVGSDDDRADSAECEKKLGIPVHAIPARVARTSPITKLANWARGRSDVVWRRWSPAAVERAHEFVERGDFDVVVVDGTFAGPLLPAGFDGRVVLGLHNIEAQVVERLGGGSFASRIEVGRLSALERGLAARADVVVAVSPRDAAAVERIVPQKRVEVVQNTVDVRGVATLEAPSGDEPLTLLFVGGFDYPPNAEAARELVTAHVPELRAAIPDVRVRLVGRDPAGVVADLVRDAPGSRAWGSSTT